MKYNLLLVLGCGLLSACGAIEHNEETRKPLPALPTYTVACPDERPQICTQEYLPVCATTDDLHQITLGNACTACGNEAVLGYTKGECK